MGSLSKRSSAPGLRSGFAAGDKELLSRYMQYRTYFGSAMSNAVQLASVAAWRDERHVIENRRLYREKFAAFYERVNPVLPLTMPDAAFTSRICGAARTTRRSHTPLRRDAHHRASGSYISREAAAVPGRGFVRMALVSTVETRSRRPSACATSRQAFIQPAGARAGATAKPMSDDSCAPPSSRRSRSAPSSRPPPPRLRSRMVARVIAGLRRGDASGRGEG